MNNQTFTSPTLSNPRQKAIRPNSKTFSNQHNSSCCSFLTVKKLSSSHTHLEPSKVGNINKQNMPDCLFWYWDQKKHLNKSKQQKGSKLKNFNKLGNANNRKRLQLKKKCEEDKENSEYYGNNSFFPSQLCQSGNDSSSRLKKLRKGSVHKQSKGSLRISNKVKCCKKDIKSQQNINRLFYINSVRIQSKKQVPFGQQNYTLNIEHNQQRPLSAMNKKVVTYSRISNQRHPKRPHSYHKNIAQKIVPHQLFITAK